MAVSKTNFNINSAVFVRLTDHGRARHRANWDEFIDKYPPLKDKLTYHPPKEDAEGWSEWQLWHLMQEFGQYTSMGQLPCFETVIKFSREAP